VNYYGNPKLDRLKSLIDAEVRNGVHSLRASYLSNKYEVEPALAQKVLSDLVATGDLSTHYQLLCSGVHQRYEVDKEYIRWDEIPRHELTCGHCGDRYIPAEENIIVSFEPTDLYLQELAHQS
jgi:hypothetical protein